MNLENNIAPVSSSHLLTCLYLAIDEARLSKSLIKSREQASRLEKGDPLSEKLVKLNKEIDYLEAKLIQIRATADRD